MTAEQSNLLELVRKQHAAAEAKRDEHIEHIRGGDRSLWRSIALYQCNELASYYRELAEKLEQDAPKRP